MSSASRWATADEPGRAQAPSDRDISSKTRSDYDAELAEVLGRPPSEARVEGGSSANGDEEEGEEAGFQYTGTDSVSRESALGESEEAEEAEEAFDYDAQMADVLGQPKKVVPAQTASFPKAQTHSDPDVLPEPPASTSHPLEPPALSETASPPPSEALTPDQASPAPATAGGKLDGFGLGTPPSAIVARRPPLLNAQLSRLRSSQRFPSSSSFSSFASEYHNRSFAGDSSKFGALSRASSASNLKDAASASSHLSLDQESNLVDLAALTNLASSTSLRWNPLRKVSARVFTSSSHLGHHQHHPNGVSGFKGRALPDAHLGQPTCMSASGMICVGTSKGWTLVFDFAQTLKCICGNESVAESSGSVTALAVSSDHTFVAVGHASGAMHLYSLAKPAAPARTVLPTDLRQVLAGRAEGHLAGSAIRRIGFIGARHTAVVSSDERGLAFFHHLGQVLGLANTNVVRIIGRYPMTQAELEAPPPPLPHLDAFVDPQDALPMNNASTMLSEAREAARGQQLQQPQQQKSVPPVFDVAPLPLGPQPHDTDPYSLVAIITPFKLLVAALKPTPRTLWRVLHKATPEDGSKIGSLSWWPSGESTAPILAFSWGPELRMVSVHEEKEPLVNGDKAESKERRALKFKELGKWDLEEVALRILWMNARTLLLIGATHASLWDTVVGTRVGRSSLDLRTLASPLSAHPQGAATPSFPASTGGSILAAHNVDTYKGKVFALALADVRVAAILTWADRIISLVNSGSLVEAIELTTLYYEGQTNSASIGLAEDVDTRHHVVAPKLREIMLASMEYVFSQERLSDHTHVTADGQGVDRTPLFESLVDACVRACIACQDLDFVFVDLFERFQDNGIAVIFLRRLKPFVLARMLSTVPTLLSSQLIDLCEQQGQVEEAEQLVYAVEPLSLDLDHALKFAERHELWDCQIYVETAVLQDWQTPFARLLSLVATIEESRLTEQHREVLERRVPEAFKVFAFLASSLSGLTYPTGSLLQSHAPIEARRQSYSMLFSKHPMSPQGTTKTLVVSASQLPYPYLTLLLRFDTEALLDALDQALEDPFLDEHPVISRQEIITLLLDLALDAPAQQLSSAALAFIYIFVARNLPKYPQYITVSEERLHTILLALLQDPDQSTREDRQLATEYLLSVFRPLDSDEYLTMLKEAGFFRVLRSQHRSQKQWAALASASLQDPDLGEQVFDQLAQTFRLASKAQASEENDMSPTVVAGVPHLIDIDLPRTVDLISQHLPQHHLEALETLSDQPNRRFAYLRYLLDPEVADEPASNAATPEHQELLREAYVELLCHFDPNHVVPYLSGSNQEVTTALIRMCETQGLDAAVIWAYGRNGEVRAAVDKFGQVVRQGSSSIWSESSHKASGFTNGDAASLSQETMEKLLAAATVSIQVCADRPCGDKEDVWLSLLTHLVELTSSFKRSHQQPDAEDSIPWVGRYAQEFEAVIPSALSALMSSSSLDDISFSRLTKRLIQDNGKRTFGDFKPILHGIEEAYRFEGETLRMAKELVDEDLFEQGASLRKQRARGWAAGAARCQLCQQPAWGSAVQTPKDRSRHDAVSDLMSQIPDSNPTRSGGSRDLLLRRKPSLKGKEAPWPEELNEDPSGPQDMLAHSPDDSLRALVVTRSGSVFHRSCYEHGSSPSDDSLQA